MAQVPLPAAAERALRAVGQLRRSTTRAGKPVEPATPMGAPEVTLDSEPRITDEANWLDLNREEQIAFDEKLSAFLDLDVENKERNWLLPKN